MDAASRSARPDPMSAASRWAVSCASHRWFNCRSGHQKEKPGAGEWTVSAVGTILDAAASSGVTQARRPTHGTARFAGTALQAAPGNDFGSSAGVCPQPCPRAAGTSRHRFVASKRRRSARAALQPAWAEAPSPPNGCVSVRKRFCAVSRCASPHAHCKTAPASGAARRQCSLQRRRDCDGHRTCGPVMNLTPIPIQRFTFPCIC